MKRFVLFTKSMIGYLFLLSAGLLQGCDKPVDSLPVSTKQQILSGSESGTPDLASKIKEDPDVSQILDMQGLQLDIHSKTLVITRSQLNFGKIRSAIEQHKIAYLDVSVAIERDQLLELFSIVQTQPSVCGLKLSHVDFDSGLLAELEKLDSISWLRLHESSIKGTGLTDRHFSQLLLHYCTFEDGSESSFEKLSKLEVLHIVHSSGQPPELLERLPEFRKLVVLRLENLPLEKEDYTFLPNSPELRVLRLSNTGIDSGILKEVVSKYPLMEWMDLSGCHFEFQDFECLNALPNLHTVFILYTAQDLSWQEHEQQLKDLHDMVPNVEFE